MLSTLHGTFTYAMTVIGHKFRYQHRKHSQGLSLTDRERFALACRISTWLEEIESPLLCPRAAAFHDGTPKAA